MATFHKSSPLLSPLSSPPSSSSGGLVRIGTWNVSWWTRDRLGPIESLRAQLVALQETKLASIPLENVRASLKRRGYVLHHGHPVPVRRDFHGDSCVVGVLASPGVVVAPLLPQGAAWRRLHAMARVHAVLVPPRAWGCSFFPCMFL